MDFNDTPEEAAFRKKARKWLQEHAAKYAEPPTTPWSENELLEHSRAWQQEKAAAGFAGITWPADIGGQGGSEMDSVIFKDEEDRYHVPSIALFRIGNNMAVSTIRKHGTPEQLKKYAVPTLRGDIGWCQLFSEPGAGSDLAAVRTRAVREGENWRVNGQKVWSSWAHHADWGLLLARTDPTVSKHKGITFFIIDMHSPGIDIRPIQQIDGNAEFNEVFFSDLLIPDSARLGSEGEGWACAMSLLMSERIGQAGVGGLTQRMLRKALYTPRGAEGTAIDSSAVQGAIAECYTLEQGLKYFRARILTQLSQGSLPGAEAALVKLIFASNLQRASARTMDLDGYSGVFAGPDSPGNQLIFDDYIWSSAMRVAGGADEVLRNQIAERVLGMPSEVRMDKNVAFEDLPT